MKRIWIISIVLFSECIYVEDTPVKYVDLSNTPYLEINPPCSFENLVSMNGLLNKERITNIDGTSLSNYIVSGQTKDFTSSSFEMVFEFGRPKKNVIYTFTDGEVIPNNVSWYWEIWSNSYKPINGKLFVEVLPSKKVKFTWCDLSFKTSSSSNVRSSSGSFILD